MFDGLTATTTKLSHINATTTANMVAEQTRHDRPPNGYCTVSIIYGTYPQRILPHVPRTSARSTCYHLGLYKLYDTLLKTILRYQTGNVLTYA